MSTDLDTLAQKVTALRKSNSENKTKKDLLIEQLKDEMGRLKRKGVEFGPVDFNQPEQIKAMVSELKKKYEDEIEQWSNLTGHILQAIEAKDYAKARKLIADPSGSDTEVPETPEPVVEQPEEVAEEHEEVVEQPEPVAESKPKGFNIQPPQTSPKAGPKKDQTPSEFVVDDIFASAGFNKKDFSL